MKNIIFRKNGKTYTQVQKAQAKKLFQAGKDLFLIPNKTNIFSSRCIGVEININNQNCMEYKNDPRQFERIVNDFTWYNCNSELGYYPNFYVIE